MRLKVLFLLLFSSVFGISVLRSDKNGPNADYTGAPGPSGSRTCSTPLGCHNPPVDLGASLNIKFTLKGDTQAINQFDMGKTYTISIAVTGNSLAKGFQATLLDKSDNKTGTIGGVSAGAKKVSFSSRDFVEHSSPSSTGIWSFDWTPPATPPDTAYIYASGNASNNNVKSSGDDIRTGKLLITSKSILNAATLLSNQDIVVGPNPFSSQITLSEPAARIGIYDMHGQLMCEKFNTDLLMLDNAKPGFYYFEIISKSGNQQLTRVLKN